MTQFQVDSDAVLSAESALRASAGRIQSEVSAMLGHLVTLQGSWSGGASTAFQGLATEWRGTQQRVEENLAGITQALGQAGRLYADTEQNTMRMFGR